MKNITRLRKLYYYLLNRTVWRKHFEAVGKRSIVFAPMQINSRKAINIGEKSFISSYAWLLTIGKGKIEVKDGCTIGHFAHISANCRVTICDNVLVADRVFISDSTHSYDDISIPIIKQPLKEFDPIVIGEGTWLGENVCICGVSVGKHCVIGANSVVTSEVPDYCVAVGSPAKVVKKYDFENKEWIKV